MSMISDLFYQAEVILRMMMMRTMMLLLSQNPFTPSTPRIIIPIWTFSSRPARATSP